MASLLAWRAGAVDVVGVYSTACDRVVGIPLDADGSNLYVLGLDGKVVGLPRYGIAALVSYPTDVVPVGAIENALDRDFEYVKVETNYQGAIVPLVEGWPIQFTDDKISFLDKEGREVVIDRESIWSIDISPMPRRTSLGDRAVSRYRFVHPYRQFRCAAEFHGAASGRAVVVHPQEYVSDPVAIKRRLDHIIEHRAILRAYDRTQKFYAVPQVYGNQTSLGYWFSFGSRHGKGEGRDNNFTPILSNEYSLGPFGYQHIMLTGSTPMGELVHEEPQTQFYYRFKADYFHFSVFYDPNSMLLRSDKYQWQRGDLEDGDDRHVERASVGMGFDFGPISLFVRTGNAIHGHRRGDVLVNDKGDLAKYGAGYRNHLMRLDLILGRGSRFSMERLNLGLDLWRDVSWDYSLIRRGYDDAGRSLAEGVGHRSGSLTNALYANLRRRRKYIYRAMLSHELLKVDGRGSESFLKAGVSASLVF